jgi:hypothetical protein
MLAYVGGDPEVGSSFNEILSLSLSLYLFGFRALCWTLAAFQFLNPIRNRLDSLIE